MSSVLHSKAVRTLAAITATLLFIVAPPLSARKIKASADPQSREPQRVAAIFEKGPIVTLRLENGQDLDVARSVVKIKSASRKGERKSKRSEPPSITQLAQMNSVPAVVALSYAKDGSVKKAKIHVFRNDADVNAFLARRNNRVAAAAQREQQHR